MRWMWFAILILAFAGCRFHDPSIDLLEGELRWMEDQLYIMEGELEGACRELGRCQDAKQQCAERNQQLKQTRQTKSGDGEMSVVEPSETRAKRPRIVMPFQGASEDSAEPVVELPDEPVVEIPQTTVEVQPHRTSDEWEVIPSVPDGPVPPLPENLFEEGDPFVDDAIVVPATDLPGEPDLSGAPTMEPAPAVETPSNVTGSDPGAVSESTDGVEAEPTPAEAQSEDDLPRLFPLEGDNGGYEDPPPTGTRPELDGEEEDDEEPAQPADSDVSIRLLSHLEHVRGSRSRTPNRIDAHITHIVCKTNRTSAGMVALIEPRNADGNFVGLLNPGSRLEFDWPGSTPYGDNLQVYIRYVTVDGRRIQAQQPLGDEKDDDGKPLKLFSDLTSSDWEVESPNSDFEVVSSDPAGWTVVRRDRRAPSERNSWGQTSEVGQKTIISNFEKIESEIVPAEPKPFRPLKSNAKSQARIASRPDVHLKLPKPLNELSPKAVTAPKTPVTKPTKVAARTDKSSAVKTTPSATTSPTPVKPASPLPRLIKDVKKEPQIPKWSPDRN